MSEESNTQKDLGESNNQSSIIRLLPITLASIAILGFVAVVWYAYNQGQSGHYQEVVPTIRADYESFKTKPDEPGGMEIPNQDKFIFEQAEDQEPEKLYVDDVASSVAEEVEELVVDTPDPAFGAEEKIAVEEVVTQVEEETLQLEAGAPPAVTTPAPPAPKVEPEVAKDVLDAPSKSVLYEYRVQLLSVKEKGAAEKAKKDLLPKLRSVLLPGQGLYVAEADLGDKGMYYRVQAGEFSTKAQASALCDAYKSTGGSCFVVKR